MNNKEMIFFDGDVYFPTSYEGYYASPKGLIISTKNNKIKHIKGKRDKDGYIELALSLKVDGKKKIKYIRAHRIIAETFIENTENKPTVNHKNGIRNDNSVENLEWSTYSENNLHRYHVLGAQPPGKWKIDIYENEKLIAKDLGVNEVAKMTSYEYFDCIRKNKVSYYFMYLDKEDKAFVSYWNGKIFKRFENIHEASKFFNKKLNTVYQKAINCRSGNRESESYSKKYSIVIKSRGDK